MASSSDVAAVKAAVTNQQVFCNFYLAKTRKTSPFPSITAARTTTACKCIINSLKSKTIKAVTPTPKVCPDAKCVANDVATIKAQYKNSLLFCQFFVGLPGIQTVLVVNGQTVARTTAACKVIIAASVTTTTTTRTTPRTTTTTTTTTTRSTTKTSSTTTTTSKASSTSVASTTSTTSAKVSTVVPSSSPSSSPSSPSSPQTSAPTTIVPVQSIQTTEAQTTTTADQDQSTGTADNRAGPTTSIAFCSSAAVQSLAADSRATPFCWTALAIPTNTVVVRATTTASTTVTITQTIQGYTTSITTLPVTMPGSVTETSYVTSTTYATFCGGGNTFAKRQAVQTSYDTFTATPTYLSTFSPAAITSACQCLGALPSPVTTSTSTVQGPTVTFTSSTTSSLVSTIVKTVTSVSYANTSSVPTITSTTTVTASTTVGAGTVETNALAPSVPGVFMKYPGYLPSDNIPALMSCQCSSSTGGTCDFTGYTSSTITASTCTDFSSCMSSCAYLNSKVSSSSSKCTGVYYDNDIGYCSLLGPNYLPLVSTGSCGVLDSNTSSGSGFAALIRNS
ncbi:hypothetical protein C1H76_2117 [Elsinoe australis]|uniref:Uncharacterized protein n=1 Tax=Elsinoe australis TaxID=40998 RepID=A0A4U7B3N5_9PEZI|nr:hypothetical protein C1H76_2117 [Elsinoe australis]